MAMTTTPTNCKPVTLLNMSVVDPPTQTEVQAIASKLDELLTALGRRGGLDRGVSSLASKSTGG